MKKILLFIFLLSNTLSFSGTTKFLVPKLMKDKEKLVIHISAREEKYVVKKGDTLESIAKAKKMTVEELKRRNNLKSNEDLVVGKEILVDTVENTK